MRLLHTRNKQFKEFDEGSVPTYAILSHTWFKTEVTYEDALDGIFAAATRPLTDAERWSVTLDGGRSTADAQRHDSRPIDRWHWSLERDIDSLVVGQGNKLWVQKAASLKKILWSCRQAIRDDISYIWIDTCCIDKRSSAELSEAINSMYKWYQHAEVCYAVISDYAKDVRKEALFYSSRWFSRGWTLQELLAPKAVRFYDHVWNSIGTRWSMCRGISDVTNIPEVYLKGRDVCEASIAQRMSWASKRTTTRTEDVAYCLLGIFRVNMPLLYGEGKNAFRRLQEEIMRNSVDHSLFAWGRLLSRGARVIGTHVADDISEDGSDASEDSEPPNQLVPFLRACSHENHVAPVVALSSVELQTPLGLLAQSPTAFEHSGDIVPTQTVSTPPHQLANKGLRMSLAITDAQMYLHTVGVDMVGLKVALMRCHLSGSPLEDIAIPITFDSNDQVTRLTGSFDMVLATLLKGPLNRSTLRDVYWTLTPDRPLPNMINLRKQYEQRPMFVIREAFAPFDVDLIEVYPPAVVCRDSIISRAAISSGQWEQTAGSVFKVALLFRNNSPSIRPNTSHYFLQWKYATVILVKHQTKHRAACFSGSRRPKLSSLYDANFSASLPLSMQLLQEDEMILVDATGNLVSRAEATKRPARTSSISVHFYEEGILGDACSVDIVEKGLVPPPPTGGTHDSSDTRDIDHQQKGQLLRVPKSREHVWG